MSPDGKPANHNASNVPYKPKHFLPVSIKGFADGDYAMVFGYPGGTNRYETSYGVNLSTDINNPTLVKLRDMRLRYMFEEMKKDPAVKLQLASEYAGAANYGNSTTAKPSSCSNTISPAKETDRRRVHCLGQRQAEVRERDERFCQNL